MTSPISIHETTDVLQQIFEAAKTARKTAKKKREKAKKELNKAEQHNADSFEVHILHLKHLKAKYKHKSLAAAYEIAKNRLKHGLKHSDKSEANTLLNGSSRPETITESKEHLKKHAQKVAETLQSKRNEKEKKHPQKEKKHKERKSAHTAITTPEPEKPDKKSADRKTTPIDTRNYQITTSQDSVFIKDPPIVEAIKTATVSPTPTPKIQTDASAPVKTIPSASQVAEPVKKTTTRKVQKVETVQPHPSAAIYATNDLTLVEGIGAKVAQILKDNGIATFAQLSSAESENLKLILRKNRLQMMNPATWPEQARLVVANKFDDLKALQEILKGGKRV